MSSTTLALFRAVYSPPLPSGAFARDPEDNFEVMGIAHLHIRNSKNKGLRIIYSNFILNEFFEKLTKSNDFRMYPKEVNS